MKRKILTLILALVLVCTVSAVMLVGCGDKKDKNTDTNVDNTPTPQVATTYVALDINPSLELILDENDVVMSVRGLNQDASVLLHGEDGIVGANVDAAVEKIGSLSTELKYVNNENNTVNVTISSKVASKENELKSDISLNLNKGTGMELSIKTDGNYSLKREYEAFKEKYKDIKGVAEMTIAEYRVLAEAMAADATLRVEEAVKLGTDELIDRLSDAREDALDAALNILPKAEQIALKALENTYDFALERAETSAYLTVQLREAPVGTMMDWLKMSKHINYIVYKNIALSLEDVLEYAENIQDTVENDVVNGEEVQAVLDILVENGVLTADKVEAAKAEINTNGNETIELEELEAYLDKKIKNAVDEEVLENALDARMDAIEDEIDKAKEQLPEEVKAKIANISEEITAEITKHIDAEKLAGLKAEIDKAITDAINKAIEFDATNATLDAIENAAEYADEQADFYEEKVEESMAKTEGLLDKVEAYKEGLYNNEEVIAAKTALENAIKSASADANAKLTEAKANRKANA